MKYYKYYDDDFFIDIIFIYVGKHGDERFKAISIGNGGVLVKGNDYWFSPNHMIEITNKQMINRLDKQMVFE